MVNEAGQSVIPGAQDVMVLVLVNVTELVF